MQHLIQRLLLPAALLLLVATPSPASGFETSPGTAHHSAIELQFAEFSKNWIDKIDRSFTSRIGNITFETNSRGYVGRYMQVDRDSVSWSVKQTTNSPLTYIGLLEYTEWTYESQAATREAAAQGPFVVVHGRKVTEIFQYKANRWLE
ncbi:hypothetical protein [Desulfonatronum thioautotrophicum]|uniref:hypothetical protein n=1 Tax=Desulfonatronum thioautotrophicum TaxID=617001 RepID=UPI00069B5B9B|nr:hypothetical protein [Desulfonatronum thioautotrophicum]